MGEIAITVNGRRYDIRCDDGDEEHVRSLAATVDRRVSDVARTVGQAGEGRLLLLASLIMADEIRAAAAPEHGGETSVSKAETAFGASAPGATQGADGRQASDLAERINSLASRLEAVAARLEDS